MFVNKKKKILKSGISFIEVLLVIVIMGIIAALIFALMSKNAAKARDGARKHDIDLLSKPVREFQIENNSWPPNLPIVVTQGLLESIPEDPKTGVGGYTYSTEVVNGKAGVKICSILEVPKTPDSAWCWRSNFDSAMEVSNTLAFASPSPGADPGGGGSGAGGGSGVYAVVPVILFGSDTPYNLNDFKTRVDENFENVKTWFSGQLAGKTFNTLPALVYREPVKTEADLANEYTPGTAMWFAKVPQIVALNGMDICNSHRYYYFVTPFNNENVAGGFVGAENYGCAHVLPGTASTPRQMGRWLGGVGDPNWFEWWADEEREARGGVAHELGHGFGGECVGGICNGLPHSSAPSVMWSWWDFQHPDSAYAANFSDYEKGKILSSPFIQ